MQITDLAEFNRILDHLGIVFSKAPTDDIRRTYFEALKQFPLAAIRERAMEHTATGKFFPKPVELRPASEPGEKSKGPPVGSVAWWSMRERVLRDTLPKGLDAVSRANLDLATFGREFTPEAQYQSAECYERTWPGTGREMYREAAGTAPPMDNVTLAARRMAPLVGMSVEDLLAKWAREAAAQRGSAA